MTGAVLLIGVSAVTIGAVFSGCGGALGTQGTGGAGGTAPPGGTAGEMSSRGGASGGGGTGGSACDAGSSFGQPVCPAGVSSGVACTPSDFQLCYKACGVEQLGAKTVTCEGGLYQQMSGCSYDPSRDYSCYKIPPAASYACPVDVTPQASLACNVPTCVLCNSLQGVSGGMFLDSLGAAKTGYCVCQPLGTGGVRTWSCATDNTWPCPLGAGC